MKTTTKFSFHIIVFARPIRLTKKIASSFLVFFFCIQKRGRGGGELDVKWSIDSLPCKVTVLIIAVFLLHCYNIITISINTSQFSFCAKHLF